VIKSRKIKFAGKSKWKRQLGRLRSKSEDNIKTVLGETGCENVACFIWLLI
jgi:hypothetical protein